MACGEPSAPTATRFLSVAVQPNRTVPNVVLTPAPQVVVRFSGSGEVDTTFNSTITLTLGPAGTKSQLLGTRGVRAVAGAAQFDDLRIDGAGLVALHASAPGVLKGSSRPIRVVVPYPTVASGVTHSCATTLDKRLYCWGENSLGQLGNRNVESKPWPQPVQAPAGVGFTVVGAGGYHACALTDLGKVYCWGLNTSYELADSSNQNRTTPTLVHLPPTAQFTALGVGYHHSCAIAAGGTTYCWGGNAYGQLGDSSATTPQEPVAVASPGGAAFTAVSAGVWHTCAITALGAAYCWGANDYGALGNGTGDSSLVPTEVTAPAGVTFTTISAGSMHSCGLTATGLAYCWGRNDVGQLGDGTTTSRSTPVVVAAPAGVHFIAISAGQFRSCAVTDDGMLYCWGYNSLLSLLGDGTTVDRWMPVPLSVPDQQRITKVSVSVGEMACAASEIGLAYCWGYNGFGQVGDSTYVIRSTPHPVLQ